MSYHYIDSARRPCRSTRMGNPWNGTYVTATGNLKMDMLHNFFLECGARANKIRVYEMTNDPVARATSATCWCAAAFTSSPMPRRSRS